MLLFRNEATITLWSHHYVMSNYYVIVQSLRPAKIIPNQPHSWYKILCAPTHSLVACFFSVLMMFFINWLYSIIVLLVFILLVYYIHITSPGLAPGLSAHFSFFEYMSFKWKRLFNKNLKKDTFLIISPPTINSR